MSVKMYRATRRYANGQFSVTPGQVVELEEETAALVERDSAGTLEVLSDGEVAKIERAIKAASKAAGAEVRPDWSPGPPFQPPAGTGGGPVMGTGDHPGLRRG